VTGALSIFIGSLLLIASIVGSRLSARVGAPLLLVFLAIGMLAGENGPGGISFDDVDLCFVIGSGALAVILFDGGLRTDAETIRVAWRPGVALATVGVVVTAGVTALACHWIFAFDLARSLLIGSIVASTDAAAVFLMVGRSGIQVRDRLRATLELESGSNDPMGVFLTLACVHLITEPGSMTAGGVLVDLVGDGLIGGVLGVLGGRALAGLINRLELAPGLYPILALAVCLFTFSATQLVGGSGFLAVYLAGIAFNLRRVRAKAFVVRFFDGLSWLAQIILFLLLGLLVTPVHLLADWPTTVGVALVLILVARPLAVMVSLTPFRFSWREQLFASWLGLRGAVPIFLALIPLSAGIDSARDIFNVSFVVVLVSLLVQGWTIQPVMRWLGLGLAPMPEAAPKIEYDMQQLIDRDLVAYTIKPHSRATDFPLAELALPDDVRIVTVIRNAAVLPLEHIDRLKADDFVLVLVPPARSLVVDRFFSRRFKSTAAALSRAQADFVVDGRSAMDELIRAYGLPLAPGRTGRTVGEVLAQRIGPAIGRGDRVRFGEIELVVIDMIGPEVKEVGLVIRAQHGLRGRLAGLLARLRRRLTRTPAVPPGKAP